MWREQKKSHCAETSFWKFLMETPSSLKETWGSGSQNEGRVPLCRAGTGFRKGWDSVWSLMETLKGLKKRFQITSENPLPLKWKALEVSFKSELEWSRSLSYVVAGVGVPVWTPGLAGSLIPQGELACGAIATLLFDPWMTTLPLIVKQNSPSVGLFTL